MLVMNKRGAWNVKGFNFHLKHKEVRLWIKNQGFDTIGVLEFRMT